MISDAQSGFSGVTKGCGPSVLEAGTFARLGATQGAQECMYVCSGRAVGYGGAGRQARTGGEEGGGGWDNGGRIYIYKYPSLKFSPIFTTLDKPLPTNYN